MTDNTIRLPAELSLTQAQLDALDNMLRKARKVAVLSHISIDADAFGSAMAIARLVQINYNVPAYFFTEEDIPSGWLDILPKQQLDTTFRGVGDLLKAVTEYMPSTVIVVDIHRTSRLTIHSDGQRQIGNFLNNSVKDVIVIDHHLIHNEEYGNLIINRHFTSTAELIMIIAERLGWEYTRDVAEFLLLGLLGDLGRFRWLKYPQSLLIAHRLLSMGADWHKLFGLLDITMTPALKDLFAWFLSAFNLNKYSAWIFVPLKKYRSVDVRNYSLFKDMFIEQFFPGMRQPYLLIMTEKKPGVVYASIRGKDDKRDLSEFAARYNGGGHRRASGFRFFLNEVSPETVAKEFEEFLSKTG